MKPDALTSLSVERYAKRASRYEVPDSKVAGLRLVVQPSGAKSWCVRYSRHNHDRRFTLGAFPTLKLDAARKRAGEALAIVAAGRDPGEERKAARRAEEHARRSAVSVAATWERFMSEHVRPQYAKTTRRNLEGRARNYLLPVLARLPINGVDPEHIKKLSEPAKRAGHKVTANKIFKDARTFFGWCVNELIIKASANPCAGLSLPCPEAEGGRDRVLNHSELSLVWRASDELGYPFGPFTKLLILTLARESEVQLMARSELSLAPEDTATAIGHAWTLPATRTKNKREHVIPLAPPVLALLDTLPHWTSGLIFTTTDEAPIGNFSNAKDRIDAIIERLNGGVPLAHWVWHDLRRTGDTEMHEIGVAPHIVEACVNHISGHKKGVAGTYNRAKYLKEKRAAFALWAEHVTKLSGV